MRWRVGIDIGGTFTDFVLQDVATGALVVGKHLTTPGDPSDGVFEGLAELLKAAGADLASVEHAVHGTTLGANLVIERKGARTFLVTTRGFRDVLEIQRQLRYNINDLFVDKHPPLIPRDQIVELTERLRADGAVHVPLRPGQAREALETCRRGGAESLAVALLHAYANPAHEEQVAALAAEVLPGVPVTSSAAVSPRYREYERTSTAVVNAYIAPRFRAYLQALDRGLRERGFRHELFIMQNHGGIATSGTTARYPVRSLDSGPAAGAILAAEVGRLSGHPDLIAFDMGGTTAKACLVERGEPTRTDRLEVDLIEMRPGSGLPLDVPSVGVIEIGAGGGSIARVERGILRVGPDSAGADPGPACYGLGGREPTVTDANLVLGYLDPEYFLGGARRLDREAAVAAIEDRVARPLGLGLVEAAWGIHQLVNVSMERAIRVVSIGRGKDPRTLACVSFGGAGPIHGTRLARDLGISRVLVPFAAGVASAIGLLVAEPRFALGRTLVVRLDEAPWEQVNALLAGLEAEGAAQLRATGLDGEWRVRRTAEVRYAGQGHELRVPVPAGPLGPGSLAGIRRAHAEVYTARYGYAEPDAPLEAVSWSIELAGAAPGLDLRPRRGAGSAGQARKGVRPVYAPEAGGFVECPVCDRYRLGAGTVVTGPGVIEEREATVVLLPGDRATVDDHGTLVIDVARVER
jgi:N-methylhydantoinase A/oxoprolinase/acetone carboxylase beta subunit